ASRRTICNMEPSGTVPPLLAVFLGAVLSAVVAAWLWVIGRLRVGRPLLPPEKSRSDVPWGPGALGAVLLLWVILNVVVGSGVHRVLADGGRVRIAPDALPEPSRTSVPMLMVAFINLGMLLLVPAILALGSGARREHLGLRRGSIILDLAGGVVGCLLTLPAV